MTTPPAATRGGAFLALALADALSLGLPGPDYITMSPRLAGSATSSAISFQFNDRNGQDPLPAMQAWAGRFGAAIDVSAGSGEQPSTWHKFEFTHAGVLFDAYAKVAAAQDDDEAGGDVCMKAGCSHGEDEHTKSVRQPGDGVRLIGCRECGCNGYLSPEALAKATAPAELVIEVTADDIRLGEQASVCLCPIARAAARLLGLKVPDDGFSTGLTVCGGGIDVWNDDTCYWTTYLIPKAVRDFIQDFDFGREVAPFTFTAHLEATP